MYADGEVCRLDEDRVDIGAYCPIGSMVRESYGGIIGDVPARGDPVRESGYGVGGSLRRRADTAMVGGDDDAHARGAQSRRERLGEDGSVCPRSCPR